MNYLVSHTFVLSSAHCYQIQDNQAQNLQVLAGFRNYPSNDDPHAQAYYKITSIKIHEKYEALSEGQFNDIAVIKVESPIRFSRLVAPVCLPFRDTFMKEEFYERKSFDLVAWNKYK